MTHLTPDPWHFLQPRTSARIALGRAGGSLPTKQWLQFSADHAAARDAVHTPLNLPQLHSDLAPILPSALPILTLTSQAPDRPTYLQYPDRGSQLSSPSTQILTQFAAAHPAGFDLVLIIADGLSARAAQSHAPTLLTHLLPALTSRGITLAPLTLATQARVALQDPIGSTLRARAALILLGERPGLASPDSLGAYLVYHPNPNNTNAHRNCVSNIRPAGLPPAAAAQTLLYLLTESLTRQLSGIQLKDDRPHQPTLPSAAP